MVCNVFTSSNTFIILIVDPRDFEGFKMSEQAEMYTAILNTGKHFLKKKRWLLATAKKKRKKERNKKITMIFNLWRTLLLYWGFRLGIMNQSQPPLYRTKVVPMSYGVIQLKGGCTGKRYQEYHSISSPMFPISFWLPHSHRPLGPSLTCMFISNTVLPLFNASSRRIQISSPMRHLLISIPCHVWVETMCCSLCLCYKL